ncbi:alpha/beta fold hydrolase [Asanoa siamensis]|uniref:Alpha/beta hydrolase n=1 Tax=Asanoa siamensis TaxID=926357 RepID=A0ABQ4CQP1_9ACTN|nr:alpha/beta hydrolase [Asanoa siamensis]GIF73600.1 hypothetical protein Asi02nite_31180 [Asanoa siamensis]
MRPLLLVPGGFWDGMDGALFWERPGVAPSLRGHGFEVIVAERLARARRWADEAAHLARALPDGPVTVVAGSNGCSAAVRLVLSRPGRVARLLLAWPATAGDAEVDGRTRSGLAGSGAPPSTVDALLAGGTLRGVDDEELAGLTLPVGVLPSVPDNPTHQRRTVDALLRLVPGARELPGCPEPPRPEFAGHLAAFTATVAAFAS